MIANCDEFIYYDDLVREKAPKKPVRRKKTVKAANDGVAPVAEEISEPIAEPGDRTQHAIDLVVETFEALIGERGEDEKIWGSMIKQALKRRNPGFNESYHGFRSFNNLLEEAQLRGMLSLERDEKSGGYIVRSSSYDASLL